MPAGTLCGAYRAARHALAHMGVGTLVLVADAGSPAERLYRSVGFLPSEQEVAMERWEPDETGPHRGQNGS